MRSFILLMNSRVQLDPVQKWCTNIVNSRRSAGLATYVYIYQKFALRDPTEREIHIQMLIILIRTFLDTLLYLYV